MISLDLPPDAVAGMADGEGRAHHLVEVQEGGLVLADSASHDGSSEDTRYAVGDRHLLVNWSRVIVVTGLRTPR